MASPHHLHARNPLQFERHCDITTLLSTSPLLPLSINAAATWILTACAFYEGAAVAQERGDRSAEHESGARARGASRRARVRVGEHSPREADLCAQAGASAAMEHGAAQLPGQDLPAAVRLLLRQRAGHHSGADRRLGRGRGGRSRGGHRGGWPARVRPRACVSGGSRQGYHRVGELLEDRVHVRSLRGCVQGWKLMVVTS